MGFRILKRRTGWRLLHRVDRGRGKHTEERIIKEPELGQYGLSYSMSIEEAKQALSRIRADEKARQATERQARSLAKKKEHHSAWLPPEWVEEFEKTILPEASLNMSRWLIVKELIAKLPLPPDEWHWRPAPIVTLLKEMGAGPDYAK